MPFSGFFIKPRHNSDSLDNYYIPAFRSSISGFKIRNVYNQNVRRCLWDGQLQFFNQIVHFQIIMPLVGQRMDGWWGHTYTLIMHHKAFSVRWSYVQQGRWTQDMSAKVWEQHIVVVNTWGPLIKSVQHSLGLLNVGVVSFVLQYCILDGWARRPFRG